MTTAFRSETWNRRDFLRGVGGLSFGALAAGSASLAQEGVGAATAPALENETLRVSLSPQDAAITVLDKRDGFVWRQSARPGFRVTADSLNVTPASLTAKVIKGRADYEVRVSFDKQASHAFELTLDAAGRQYVEAPDYPFPFAAPGAGWHYVQNTSGEGMLMPMAKAAEINKPFGWSGSQPWWGLTDLRRAMRARLDTFRLPDSRTGRDDETVYAAPLRVNYAFFTAGGYVGLAKDFRSGFLRSQANAQSPFLPLSERVKDRPATAALKDGVYVYLWGKDPAEDLALVSELQAAGIERGIAVFYGKHEINRALGDGIRKLGWVMGLYQMPTGNLFHISKNRGWPKALLTGRLASEKLLAESNRRAWDRVCGKQILKEWPEKAKARIEEYGLQLFYFDTLVNQLTPCVDPDHPSTIEENQAARCEIMRRTREMGMVVGSGEGQSPAWALPELDFFEGLMSLRTYADPPLKIPSGDYEQDQGDAYREQAAFTLDETRRIPLYQLAFHDYVAGTWVWRDANYQSAQWAWKKDLFNILYGTMPLWHITRGLWARHKNAMLASYRDIASVRARIGFAEMLNHGWLTEDRSVQFSEWSTGDRVTVNFGDRPFERAGQASISPRSFAIE